MGNQTRNAISNLPTLSTSNYTKAAVYHVQNLLGLKADGIYGPDTKAAVIAWQSNCGLTEDGVVGYNTWMSFA